MLGIVGAVLNAAVMVVGLLVKVLTGLAKLLVGLVRAVLPGK
jgi:hypothetical protein